MKLVIPNIIWHGDKERVLAIAFHPFQNLLVTGGSDSKQPLDVPQEIDGDQQGDEQFNDHVGYIKMWEMVGQTQEQIVKFIGALDGHDSTVNCLKFSPNGQYLASGSDDNKIFIWEKRMRPRMGTTEHRLTWCKTKVLTGHNKEVYDLCWSNCGIYLVSGSLDNRAILWHVQKQKLLQIIDGHNSYVQGVVFDPKTKFIVTVSSDRSARVWKTNKKSKKSLYYNISHVIKKLDFKVSNSQIQEEILADNQQGSVKLFLDENVIFTFVRRPDWSPDGSIFILPCGIDLINIFKAQYSQKQGDKTQLGALLFLRSQTDTPALFINTNNKPAIVVKFCPILFKKEQEFSIIDVPYKMVYAIATIDQVLIYTTQSLVPIAIFGNMHYGSITDLSFRGSSHLGISACDGFCSFVLFQGELGQEYPLEDLNEEIRTLFVKEDYYSVNTATKQPIIDASNQVQRTEIIETAEGQKKRIVPKMIGTL